MAKLNIKGDEVTIKLARSKKFLSQDKEKQEVVVTKKGRVLWRSVSTTPHNKVIRVGWMLKKTIKPDDATVTKELRSWRGKGFRKV